MAKTKFLDSTSALRTKAFRDTMQANAFLERLKIVDLKRQAIIRGCPFEVVSNGSVHPLQSFIIANFHVVGNKDLLTEYDNWAQEKLKDLNIELFGRPETPRELRLGSFEDPITKEVKPVKVKGVKAVKVPVERNSFGIIKGTAKAYTFYLVEKGFTLDKVLTRMAAREKFTNISPKSISIWYKRAKKSIDGANTK